METKKSLSDNNKKLTTRSETIIEKPKRGPKPKERKLPKIYMNFIEWVLSDEITELASTYKSKIMRRMDLPRIYNQNTGSKVSPLFLQLMELLNVSRIRIGEGEWSYYFANSDLSVDEVINNPNYYYILFKLKTPKKVKENSSDSDTLSSSSGNGKTDDVLSS